MEHTMTVLIGIMSLSIVFVENVWGNIRRLMRENHLYKWAGLERGVVSGRMQDK